MWKNTIKYVLKYIVLMMAIYSLAGMFIDEINPYYLPYILWGFITILLILLSCTLIIYRHKLKVCHQSRYFKAFIDVSIIALAIILHQYQPDKNEKKWSQFLEPDKIEVDSITIRNAKNGDIDCLLALGDLYRTGFSNHIEPDFKKAMDNYQMAAAQGDSTAYYNIGYMYYKGLGVKVDHDMAYYYLTQAQKMGMVKANYAMLELERKGKIKRKNDNEMMEWMKHYANQGYGEFQFSYAIQCLANDKKEEGEDFLRRAAANNHASAMNLLATRLINTNQEESLKWANLAIERKNTEAYFTKALIQQMNWNDKNRMSKAIETCKEGAKHNNLNCMILMSKLYLSAEMYDTQKSKYWERKAAELSKKQASRLIQK